MYKISKTLLSETILIQYLLAFCWLFRFRIVCCDVALKFNFPSGDNFETVDRNGNLIGKCLMILGNFKFSLKDIL